MISVVISVTAAIVITGKEVSYTDNKSIGASNVQDAIDGTYSKANTLASNVTNLNNDFDTGVIKVVSFYTTMNSRNYTSGSSSNIVATTQSGYTFVAWIGCHTDTWVGSVYPESPTSSSSKLWNATNISNSSGAAPVYCEALYRKNK